MTSRRFARMLAALTAVLLLARPAPMPAQTDDLSKLDTSLKFVPADASFYATSLRLGEQMDRFLASNAFAKLRALPAVQLGLEHLRQHANDPDNPLAHIHRFFDDPANRDLAALLHDFWRREIVVYGGANWTQFLPILAQVNSAQQFAPLTALLSGGDPQFAQARAILRTLNSVADKLQVPEIVFGFRLAKAEPAVTQIKRLEGLLVQFTDQHPQLKGRVRRTPVAGGDALTVTLDGAMVPWDQVPWGQIEEKKDEYEKLVAKLKTLTLTVNLVVKNDYLLLAIGPTTGTVEQFGRGPALATRQELRPLAKFADRPIIEVNYLSQAMATAAATSSADIEGLFANARTALAKAPISDQRRQQIDKDLEQLAKDIGAQLPKPSARMSFSFLTPRGQEGYSYVTDAAPATAAQLTILDHVGGAPLVAVAGHVNDPTPGYKAFAKWVGVFYAHAEGVLKEMAPEQLQQQYKAIMDIAQPYLRKFDEITSSQYFPALGQGQAAFVIDAKWTSKSWFPGLEQGGKDLPLLELGFVRTVQNATQYVQALQSYREWVNGVLAKAREFGAPLPPEGIPRPEAKKVAAGTLYFWSVPPVGQDAKILPNLAVSDKAVAVTLSQGHSERLLTPAPLKVDGGPLAERRPLQAAAVVDFAGLIGALRPWVEQFILPLALSDVPADAPKGLSRMEITDQVRTVLDVLQCFRGASSATYREGNAIVTHSEMVFQDLK
jgi:hypothetical protein